MERHSIIKELKNYFKITELVGSRTASKYGEVGWRFFETNALHALLILRKNIDKPVFCNRGNLEQRGLRTNVQHLVKDKTERNQLYISAHILGRAFDLDVQGMTAEEVRDWIEENADLFPFKIRLEDGVTWVHIDTIDEEKNPKIYRFLP